MTVETGRRAFRWCISTLGCPKLTIDEAIALAANYGIHSLELRTLGGSLDLHGYFAKHVESDTEKFLELAASGKIAAIDTSFGIASNTHEDRNELLKYAMLADSLGASRLRVFGGFPFAEEFDEKRLAKAVETLEWWAARKKRHGFKCDILLEIHDGFSSSERCLKLLKASPINLKLIWDVEHSHFAAGEPLESTWKNIGRSITHIHIRDVRRTKDGKVEMTLPGEGEMPAPALFDLLGNVSYKGMISLEWEKYWHPELPELSEVLSAAKKAGWIF